jgi:hypothetical protein
MMMSQKQKLEQYKVKDQEPGKWGTLNVLGQPAEPICTYYRCHHKFSLQESADASILRIRHWGYKSDTSNEPRHD